MLGRRRFRWRGGSAYVVLGADGQEQRRVEVGVTPYGAGTDTLINFLDHAIQPRFIDSNVNITLIDPESVEEKIPFFYTGGNAGPSNNIYCPTLGNDSKAIRKMFDGDLTTAFFRPFTQDPNLPPGFGDGWGGLAWGEVSGHGFWWGNSHQPHSLLSPAESGR